MQNKKTLLSVNHKVGFVTFLHRLIHLFTEHTVITDYELDSVGGWGLGEGTEYWRSRGTATKAAVMRALGKGGGAQMCPLSAQEHLCNGHL